MRKIEHIGIAVKSLDEGESLFTRLLGSVPYKREEVGSESVKTAFYRSGPNKIELLAALNEDSPIARYIDKRGEGIHHIAFDVPDIKAEMEHLKNEGFLLLSESPQLGADNKLVCFIHPKSAHGVLIELCQEIT